MVLRTLGTPRAGTVLGGLKNLSMSALNSTKTLSVLWLCTASFHKPVALSLARAIVQLIIVFSLLGAYTPKQSLRQNFRKLS